MSRKEVLQLLKELLQDAYHSKTDPDDQSGISTRYYVDQEQLMRNIEAKLEQYKIPDGLRIDFNDY